MVHDLFNSSFRAITDMNDTADIVCFAGAWETIAAWVELKNVAISIVGVRNGPESDVRL